MPRRLSLVPVVALVAGLTTAVLVTQAATSPQPAAAEGPTSAGVTVFAAVPSDGELVLDGLLQGDPNTETKLEVWTGPCDSETAPSGFPDLILDTNAQGFAYFSDTLTVLTDMPEGVSLVTSDLSEQSNCYPVTDDNTSWEHATDVSLFGGAGESGGVIALPGESRWYKFDAPPDSTMSITLSGLQDNLAIAAYGDIASADADLSGGSASLNKLSAEFASDTFSPSAFIPSAFIPSAFIPSAFIPSAFIPSAFIPDAFTASSFTPSSYSPSAFIPSEFLSAPFIPSAFDPQTYSAAVNRSLITYSAENGTSDKTLTINTWQSGGPFYIRVSGPNGAEQDNEPFQLSISGGSDACSASVLPIGSAPAPAPGTGRQTVILTDSSQVSGSSAAVADMMARLQTLAARPEVNGAVVDLATDSRVQALDTQAAANPGCPYATNLVANAIRDIVTSYRAHNPLKYVVIAGPDNAVPFFRHPDQTLIGNETGYTPPVADDSPAQAALRLGYTLSDNDYGAKLVLSTRTDQLPVPDLAVGRLVESASEISGMVTAYLQNSGGVLPTPSSALVTGYDFLTLPANQVEADLTAGLGHATDTLIAPRTQAPADSWTAADLKQKVLDSGRHDILFLAGHFSANDALAADYTTDMITTDLDQSAVNLQNSLVFSAGCHSGYNIDDVDAVPGVTLKLDWPEEFARKQAILVGGTGYQYGDTDFVAYSEQIDADFAHELRYGTGPVSIGQALLNAKQNYLSSTPSLDAIGQKAVYEATLYGLPMASINLPSGRIPRPIDTSVVGSTTAVAADPGNTLGLRTADLTVTPNLTRHDTTVNDLTNSNSAVTASYYSGDQGTVVSPYQPVLPLENENVSVAGQSLRGALFLGGSYSDEAGVTPLTGAPATEIRGVHTGFSSPTFFPEKPWNINYFDALSGANGGGTRFMVTPAQHMDDPDSPGLDIRRTFDSMRFQMYYSDNTSTFGSGPSAATPALAAAPDIVSVQTFRNLLTNQLDICATIGGDPTAGVQRAVATYTDPSADSPQWNSSDLTQGGCNPDEQWRDVYPGQSTSWGGAIDLSTVDPDQVQFMVQAVSGTGLVSVDDNLGKYYGVPVPPPNLTTFAFIDDIHLSTTAAPFDSTLTITANVHTRFDPIEPLQDAGVTFTVGSQTATGFSDYNGDVTASLKLDLPIGSYPVTATLTGDGGYFGDPAIAPDTVDVTKQPTLLTIAPTGGSLPTGDTSYTATLCATTHETCGDDDPPLANRSVVFKLSGATAQTTAVMTNSSGQARFDAYGLTPGDYTLTAYFDGTIPDVGTFSDPYYADADPVHVDFSTTTSYTTPPTLTLPNNITVALPSGETGGTVVPFAAGATDPIDPRPQVSCSPGPTTFFAVGTTTVNCTATDTAGNTAHGSFTVTVTTGSTTIPVAVAGSQPFGSATPTFTYTATPPAGAVISGTLHCTKLSTGASISPTLAVGRYKIDPTTCSGLTVTSGYSLTYTSAAKDFTVSKAGTALVAAPVNHFGPIVTFAATLTSTVTGAPLPNQTVTFSIAGQRICAGVTDGSGRATCTAVIVVLSFKPKPRNYKAVFAGTAIYAASSTTARIFS